MCYLEYCGVLGYLCWTCAAAYLGFPISWGLVWCLSVVFTSRFYCVAVFKPCCGVEAVVGFGFYLDLCRWCEASPVFRLTCAAAWTVWYCLGCATAFRLDLVWCRSRHCWTVTRFARCFRWLQECELRLTLVLCLSCVVGVKLPFFSWCVLLLGLCGCA